MTATFAYLGTELVGVTVGEAQNPRRTIPRAIRLTFFRIVFFYILCVFLLGMIVPYNDSSLLTDTNNAAESPYVIAMTRAGISVLPHIINAGVFSSAFSAGNSFLFCSSRVLYGLAIRGQAPKLFAYCTKNGLPIAAILVSGAFAWLSFMNVSSGAETVFK